MFTRLFFSKFNLFLGQFILMGAACLYFSAGTAFAVTSPTATSITPNSGTYKGGTTITINGTNFKNIEEVSLKTGGGAGTDQRSKIEVDSAGNIYWAGTFEGTATFAGSTVVSAGSWDVFLAKFDSAGNLLWIRSGGGTDDEDSTNIYLAVDKTDGSAYISGWSISTSVTFGTITKGSGSGGAFLVKYDTSGTPQWVKLQTSGGNTYPNPVTVDANHNVYLGLSFSGTATIDGTSVVSAGGYDWGLVKFNSGGTLQWMKRGGGAAGDDLMREINLDAYTNTLYAVGDITGTATFGSVTLVSAGANDSGMIHYDTDGNALWGARLGGTGAEESLWVTTTSDSVYWVGAFFSPTVTVGPSTLTNSFANRNGYLAKLDKNGNFLWAKGNDDTGLQSFLHVVAKNDNEIYVSGFYASSLTIGSFNLTSSGAQDAMLLKFDSSGNILGNFSSTGAGNESFYETSIAPDGNLYTTGFFTTAATYGSLSASGTGVDLAMINFQDDLSVQLGGSNCASLTYISATQLRCVTTPHDQGRVTLTVTNPAGGLGQLLNGYLYDVPEVISAPAQIVLTPSCTASTPAGIPDLFQINRKGASADLYFSPVTDSVTAYHVIYGQEFGSEQYASLNNPLTANGQGVQKVTINGLSPGQKYWFKVSAVNDCAVGSWSNWLSAGRFTATSKIFYRSIK